MLTITTNNHPRSLVTFFDLPVRARAGFDYVAGEECYSYRFFQYRGKWYDTYEFSPIVPRSRARGFAHGADDNSPLLKWDGILPDSFFSAIVLRYPRDGFNYSSYDDPSVIVGRALS